MLSILKTGTLEDILRWLRRRFLDKLSPDLDKRIRSLCLGDYSDFATLLHDAELQRLEVMTDLKASKDNPAIYTHALLAMAKVQLALISPTSSMVETFTLQVLAGKVQDDFGIPWEGLLLALLQYPSRDLASALQSLDIQGDLTLQVLRYSLTSKKASIIEALKPVDEKDWTRPFAIAHSIGLHTTHSNYDNTMRILRRSLAAQLLATGQWDLAAKLVNIDVGYFVLTDGEVKDQTNIMDYRHREENLTDLLGERAILTIKAYRSAYLGDMRECIRLLIAVGSYREAQNRAQPFIVRAIIRNDSQKVESILSDIPDDFLIGFSRLAKAYFFAPHTLEHLESLSDAAMSIKCTDDLERTALSMVTLSLLKQHCMPSLVRLLTSDHIIQLLQCSNWQQ